jgi:hypothetical protein
VSDLCLCLCLYIALSVLHVQTRAASSFVPRRAIRTLTDKAVHGGSMAVERGDVRPSTGPNFWKFVKLYPIRKLLQKWQMTLV